jgi:glc operon protein GlcG
MLRTLALACAISISAVVACTPALAQDVESTTLPPYGPPITLDQAKRVMAGAQLEAAENTWQVAITIIDSGGNLVMFQKIDNAQLSAIGISEGKARTALEFKRPSKDLDAAIARGGAGDRLLALRDITPIEGGLPIMLDGKVIGAIGVSGAISSEDTQVAQAGIAALTKSP